MGAVVETRTFCTAALAAQALVFALYFSLSISYLWYNFIGCAACMLFTCSSVCFIDSS